LSEDHGNRAERHARILFAIHSPWKGTAGLSQVFMELMRQFEHMGYACEKFSFEDAFPDGLGKFRRYFGTALFQRKLLRFIQAHGHRFDLIHTDHMLVPFPRAKYRYSGCLVVKAQGLIHFFEQYFRQPTSGRKESLGGRVLRRLGWLARGGVGSANRAFEAADQIHLLNAQELAFVSDELGFGDKAVVVPNGLTEQQRGSFAGSCPVETRVASDAVVFVGVWSLRKGKAQFPAIVRAVRQQRPSTRFRLLGTTFPQDHILPSMAPEDRDHVEVVPQFAREELPALLRDARVGVFPSHVEGFPLGVLEMLAAGLPVIAWDVPGPGEMINLIPNLPLVPADDTDRTAAELVKLLDCSREDYVALSNACAKVSERFTWNQVAQIIEDVTPGLGNGRP